MEKYHLESLGTVVPVTTHPQNNCNEFPQHEEKDIS